MAERKVNATSAFHFSQRLFWVKLLQFQMLPQCFGPMKLTSNPNATNQPTDIRISTGQCMNPPENGISQNRARRIDNAAITSV